MPRPNFDGNTLHARIRTQMRGNTLTNADHGALSFLNFTAPGSERKDQALQPHSTLSRLVTPNVERDDAKGKRKVRKGKKTLVFECSFKLLRKTQTCRLFLDVFDFASRLPFPVAPLREKIARQSAKSLRKLKTDYA